MGKWSISIKIGKPRLSWYDANFGSINRGCLEDALLASLTLSHLPFIRVTITHDDIDMEYPLPNIRI